MEDHIEGCITNCMLISKNYIMTKNLDINNQADVIYTNIEKAFDKVYHAFKIVIKYSVWPIHVI